MKPYDQLQSEIQNALDKIARVNVSIARHEVQELPDQLALEQFRDIKNQFTQQLLELLAEMDIRLKLAA